MSMRIERGNLFKESLIRFNLSSVLQKLCSTGERAFYIRLGIIKINKQLICKKSASFLKLWHIYECLIACVLIAIKRAALPSIIPRDEMRCVEIRRRLEKQKIAQYISP